jgi:hypothetical protein
LDDATRLEGEAHRAGLFQCNEKECREHTVTVGTVFERSKIALTKWLMAVYLMSASKKGMSTKQLSRMLGLPYKTAWFMTHRIREAMREGKLPGGLGGQNKVVELRARHSPSVQGFVAMWFDKALDAAFVDGFAPAIRDCGFDPLRIDRKEHANKIDDEIVAEIRRSRFVVADFTSEPDRPRGGVYFEAGFALGLNIPVIWTCRADLLGQVHFDTRQFNHIDWKEPADLRERLRNRIAAVVGYGPASR